MKAVKITLIVISAVLLAVGMSTTSYAFHSGGVAECEGCHSMHSPAAGGTKLLVGATQSATCLTCHEHAGDTGPSSYHVSTDVNEISAAAPGYPPKQRTPGGDFGWVKLSFSYTYTPSTGPVESYLESGDTHGHNVIAPANNLFVDAHNATAPGGTFPSAQLGCHSCHDPHGKYRRLSTNPDTVVVTGQPIKGSGSYTSATNNEPSSGNAVGVYRLLAGLGYTKGGVTFQGVPAAKVPSSYNQAETDNQVRVAYGYKTTGGHVSWGAWCSTCHPGMHSAGTYVHKVDEGLGGTIAGNYKTYVKSGVMTGDGTNGFSSLVPFVQASGVYATLAGNAKNDDTVLTGPGDADMVSCLSCHRAHASGFSHMLRFDIGYEFMTKNSQYIGSENVGTTGRGPLQARGRTNAMWKAAYYDREPTEFASYQRVLCNKCHAKD